MATEAPSDFTSNQPGAKKHSPKFAQREDTMEQDQKEGRDSYLTLFCALILLKNTRVALDQSLMVIPLLGSAKRLARELGKTIIYR